MSKKLRLLLVPMLVLAQSHVLRSQEEIEETVLVEDEAPEEQAAQEASPDQDDEQEEPAQDEQVTQETETVQEEPTEQVEAVEDEPQEEQAEEPAEEQEEPEQQETVVEASETVQEGSEGSPQWEPDTPLQEQSEPESEAQEEASRKYGEDEVMGIDTVDIPNPQGNWLYKRVWWERAEAKFERIRETVGKIMEVRTGFFAKRAELDKNVLDPFYIKIGMSQGELQEILNEMVSKAERLLESERNDSIQEKLEDEKRTLQSVQKQVQVVVKQDEEVEKAILMLVEQITKVRTIEQQAWKDFKAIARVLDDRKARELFYKVDAAWRTIKELQQYIEQTFATSFDALIEKLKKEVERVNQEMNALKETGTQLQQGLLGAQQEQSEMEDEQEPEPKGFFTRYIIDPITGFFKAVWSVITWPYRAVFGSAPADEDMDDDDEVMAEEQEDDATEPEKEKDDVQDAQDDDQELEIEEEVDVEQEPGQE